LNRKRNSSRVC